MNISNERQPLLPSLRVLNHRDRRSNSLTESLISIKDYVLEKSPSITTLKFIAGLVWALFAIFIFNLIFLPRTSLARDYRRLHFSTLSGDETKRLFLKALREENNIGKYLNEYVNRTEWSDEGRKAVIDYTISQLKELGFKPYTKKYYTYLNQPVESHVHLLENDKVIFKANLSEDSQKHSPVFNSFSKSGNASSGFLFANYGSIEDYQTLGKFGIQTNNTIHIIRHGKISKGLKLSNSYNSGATGVLFYSDPYDDGEITELNGFKAYPDGPARNPTSIERGSVLEQPILPHKRYFKKDADIDEIIPDIPSLPVSSVDIQHILRHLDNLSSTQNSFNWTGNLDFSYNPGPSSSNLTIQFSNLQEYKVAPLTNIYYEIPGLSNEKVIIGSHRHFLSSSGASGPNSNNAILLEISRAFSSLVAEGWRPLRTIHVASFDGGDYDNLGATEYALNNRKSLQRDAIAYLNVDGGILGSQLHASGNPLLESVLVDSAKLVPFKNSADLNIFDKWRSQISRTNQSYLLNRTANFDVFQHYLGIPSCQVFFDSDGSNAIYHRNSDFDTIDWIERYIDTGYTMHNTLAAYIGFIAVQLSEHEVISYSTLHYFQLLQKSLNKYYQDIPETWRNLKVKKGNQIAPFPSIVLELEKKFDQVLERALEFDEVTQKLQDELLVDYPWFKAFKKVMLAIKIKIVDTKAKRIDRLFLHNDGLTNRPFFKHTALATNKENGLTGDILPGIRESIEDQDLYGFVKWVIIFEECLDKLISNLKI